MNRGRTTVLNGSDQLGGQFDAFLNPSRDHVHVSPPVTYNIVRVDLHGAGRDANERGPVTAADHIHLEPIGRYTSAK